MEVLVSLIIIVFGVLQIILFFKLWGMTNDVAELKLIIKHYNYPPIPPKSSVAETPHTDSAALVKDYDSRLDGVKNGDKVEVSFDGREVSVMFVEDNRIYCKTSFLGGGQYFLKKDLKFIEKGSR